MTEIQTKILEYLEANPKASLREIAKKVDIIHATVNYHLGQLAIKNKLKKTPEGWELIN